MFRWVVIPALLFLLAAAGCTDTDRDKVDETLVIRQGQTIESEARSDDHYYWYDYYDYDEDIDYLPPGFDYDTDDVFFDWDGHMWVEFVLSVLPSVAAGLYYFEVTYELYDGWWSTIDEVEFRFTVEVVGSGHGHQAVEIQGMRGATEEEREAGAETLMRIGGD